MNEKRVTRGFGWGLLLLASVAFGASPDPREDILRDLTRRPSSERSVLGIIAGGASGTYIRVAADMASVLDGPTLRIAAMV